MHRTFKVTRGMNIPLAGAPASAVSDAPDSSLIAVFPQEFSRVRPRLHVREGESVKRGSVLFHDKANERFRFRSPAAGTVRSIVLGERRAIDHIVVEARSPEDAEPFRHFTADEILGLTRDDAVAHLLDTGYLALIRQRPFSHIADPGAEPKSIFVNAMGTAPFQADAAAVLEGREHAFQAGLNLLTRLTRGKVHLCVAPSHATVPAIAQASRVEIHGFEGPHPAGNSSVHIHRIDPIRPGETVWVVRAADLALIGELLLEGSLPSRRVVALGGPGVAAEARKHYRVRIGGALEPLLKGRLAPGEQRIISGDLLTGTRMAGSGFLRFYGASITVIPENRERRFLGWMAPGLNVFSQSRTFLSAWLPRRGPAALDTAKHGSERPMVVTGWYDRFLPLDILADYLVRAVLAHDTQEAVKLGLLETDPEDFALCAFICPSKMDLVGIIRSGLDEVEREGV